MAIKYTVHELIPELEFWIKHPTDPALRKLLRRTIQTLNFFKDLVGEPEPTADLPSPVERINDST